MERTEASSDEAPARGRAGAGVPGDGAGSDGGTGHDRGVDSPGAPTGDAAGPGGAPRSAIALGIALGIVDTRVVLHAPGQFTTPLCFDGAPALPSTLFAAAAGEFLIGRPARDAATSAPSAIEQYPLTRVGGGGWDLGGVRVSPRDVLTAILRRVVDAAGADAGAGPAAVWTGPAAIAYPPGWGLAEQRLLAESAAAAGLAAAVLVPTPVAAAGYSVSILEQPVPVGRPLLVCDFGGGRCDLSLVGQAASGLEMLATVGLDEGGLDLDAALLDRVRRWYDRLGRQADWERMGRPVTAADTANWQQLCADVRTAKELLSSYPAVRVPLPGLDDSATLIEAELTDAATPLVARAIREARDLLDHARIEPTGLAAVLLTGGSSRIPLVARDLRRMLAVEPVQVTLPEWVAAVGCLSALPGVEPAPVIVPVATTAEAGRPARVVPVLNDDTAVLAPVVVELQPDTPPTPARRSLVPAVAVAVLVVATTLAGLGWVIRARPDRSAAPDGAPLIGTVSAPARTLRPVHPGSARPSRAAPAGRGQTSQPAAQPSAAASGSDAADVATLLTAPVAPVAPVVPQSALSGMCVEAVPGMGAEGAPVQQAPCAGTLAQLWQPVPGGVDTVLLVNVASGKCLDVYGSSMVDGAAIVQWTCHSRATQVWRVVAAGPDAVSLVSTGSGKCIEVDGASVAAGALLRLGSCNGGLSQRWRLAP